MKFLTYFRTISYLMIAVAMLALVLAGGLSYSLALFFVAVMIVAWALEKSRWQVPERIGLAIVLLSIPLFYLDWQYQKAIGEPVERLGVNALAHLIREFSGGALAGSAVSHFRISRIGAPSTSPSFTPSSWAIVGAISRLRTRGTFTPGLMP